ncbi:MAG: 16S rRNA (adenine(1518)-N(6)/adenine(1519)-N(6))-dimethyltransferase RsmA [Desulfurococcaceae archaeon]
MDKQLLNRRELYKWTTSVLREYSIKPLKKLSQSFVVDPRVIDDFLNRIEPGLTTIEIGAGLGTLSYFLVDYCKNKVLLYEIDYRLVKLLREIIDKPNAIIINSDALLHEWLVEQLVSNTPYSITTDILVKLARSNCIRKAVLVLQKDVVNRLVSKPGTRNYGRITVLINSVFKIKPGRVYPPSSFYPPPEVSSQIIVLERVRDYDSEIALLEEVTRRLFSKRRRRVVKVLNEEFGLDEKTITSIIPDRDLRVYELNIGDFLRIVDLVKNYGLN